MRLEDDDMAEPMRRSMTTGRMSPLMTSTIRETGADVRSKLTAEAIT